MNNKFVNEYILPYESLIGGYTIPENICDEVVNFYKKSNDKKPGEQYVDGNITVNKDFKESTEVNVSIHQTSELKNYFNILSVCLDRYLKKYYYSNEVESFSIVENVNIQHYPKNGGFKKWHFENAGNPKSIFRHLVFMTYLNDVNDGGTEFLYQGLKTPAKKGLTVIWPATWTHTHKGEISKTKEKYIITGWYSFERHNNE